MQAITHGQNLVINAAAISIVVECELPNSNNDSIDVSAFLLSDNHKTRNDSDFIFYNQLSSLDKSVTLTSAPSTSQSFKIDLSKIDQDIQKIAFVITTPIAFKLASSLKVKVEGIAEFSPNISEMNETSLILVELYRHKGQWKFKAIGQGYAGGLAPIAIGYGVEIDDEPTAPVISQSAVSQPAAVQTSISKPAPVEPAPSKPLPTKVSSVKQEAPKTVPPVKSSAPVSIKKVDLSKAGEKATISLEKGKKLTAKLKWDTKADLDLYCFYVDKNDAEEKVYYKRLGDLSKPPFMKLLGDSQVAGEEVLEISQPDNIKYALICAYSAVSNGLGSFHSYKARVQVTDNNKQTVTSHLNHDDPRSYWVAFALIDFQQAGEVTIKNVETYSNKKTFETQFQERTGEQPAKLFKPSKADVNGVTKYDAERSPHLFKDGTFMMSVGVAEFK
ncbi:MAG: TerD family protein [Oceanospirillaceae bacterium]